KRIHHAGLTILPVRNEAGDVEKASPVRRPKPTSFSALSANQLAIFSFQFSCFALFGAASVACFASCHDESASCAVFPGKRCLGVLVSPPYFVTGSRNAAASSGAFTFPVRMSLLLS